MNVEELSRRIQRLEDVEAVRNLKARYCEACDDNYNPEAIASLFVEDAVWDGGDLLGVYRGREAIRQHMAEVSGRIRFAVHYCALNPRITVEQDVAHAHWYGLVPMELSSGAAVWFACTYDDTMVRVGGEWLFKTVIVRGLFRTPYDEGWAKKRFT